MSTYNSSIPIPFRSGLYCSYNCFPSREAHEADVVQSVLFCYVWYSCKRMFNKTSLHLNRMEKL